MKKYKTISNKNNKIRGFTLVETMVAVFILTIAITSLLGLTARSLFTARYARNEITANYLLQEVVDYIRNERDTKVFLSSELTAWDDFLNTLGKNSLTLCFSDEGCYFDVNMIEEIKKCEGECPYFKYAETQLQLSQSGSFYTYKDFGKVSNFRRTINLKSGSNPNELLVTVKVEWLNGNLLRERSLNMSFLNWLP
jgi:prepilin-type N-terminal cleavage/methylation domain-containing protein